MALADSQKISRVLSGEPFGDGRDGSLTISSNTTQTLIDETCTGTSGSTSLTAGGTSLSDDDIVLIWQTRDTGAGNWEVNQVSSGGGTTSITLVENMANTYSSGAQIIKIPLYDEITVNNSQIWYSPAWNGSTGGAIIAAANVSTTITGDLNTDSDGFNGATPTTASASTSCTGNCNAQGEGTAGASGNMSCAANGNGGGGGRTEGSQANARNASGGGGGGNGTAGSDGPTQAGSNSPTCGAQDGGTGGGATSAADLTTFTIGGGGGSGGAFDDSNPGGGGGDGAGGIFLFSKDVTFTGGASLDGDNGTTANPGGGGGGAGGAIIIQGETVDVGSSITASGGSGGAQQAGGGAGGAGGDGAIAVHYSDSVTGTTSPTLNSTEDSTLAELGLYPQTMVF